MRTNVVIFLSFVFIVGSKKKRKKSRLFIFQFYPNMMQWTPPGGFYDINSFFQLNGLSPQATFKPPTNHNVRYPSRR